MSSRAGIVSAALSVLVLAAGCGGGSSTATGARGNDAGPPPPGKRALTVTKEGAGTVRSTPPGIDCGATCAAFFAAGANVTLEAVADAGWTFNGWGGACNLPGPLGPPMPSTPGPCSLLITADGTVSATFQPVAAQPGPRYRLDVASSGNGKGRVSSNPGGIDCGTACSSSFPKGTAVSLTATPEPGSKFAGWGGACSGSDGCTVTISGDSAATATFSLLPAPDECAGLRPADPSPASYTHSFDEPLGSYATCSEGFADGAGSLLLSAGQGDGRSPSQKRIEFVSPTGALMNTSFSPDNSSPRPGDGVRDFTEQLAGFAGVLYSGRGISHFLQGWDSSGRPTGSADGGDFTPILAADPLGGSMLYLTVPSSPSRFVLDAYDETLHRRWRVAMPPGLPVALGVDRAGRALALFEGERGDSDLFGQWVDHDGKAGPPFHVLGPGRHIVGHPVLFQRVGDGLYLQESNSGQWTGQFESLSTTMAAPPDWLKARPRTVLHMVRGGKGYAVMPQPYVEGDCAQTIEVVSPSGRSCGATTFRATSGSCRTLTIHVGYDGTVVQQLPTSSEKRYRDVPYSCTWQWWPGFFR
ncbi:MAG: hypothetical protein NVS2B9_04010 [Myxococcales bacterium]